MSIELYLIDDGSFVIQSIAIVSNGLAPDSEVIG